MIPNFIDTERFNPCTSCCGREEFAEPDEEERERLKEVIVQRANQFYRALNPFRKGEANNHAWLRAFGVAESGIVLAGDHDKAVEWTVKKRSDKLAALGTKLWGMFAPMVPEEYRDLVQSLIDGDDEEEGM